MPARILLIDDEEAFITTMSKRLDKRGYPVSMAFSAQEGIGALEKETIDVVILDVKMPGMDGIEALSVIKGRFPLVEVIMLTGHATVENAIEGMKRGAFDYMMKPCDMEELLKKVGEAYVRKQDHEERIIEARARHIALRRGD